MNRAFWGNAAVIALLVLTTVLLANWQAQPWQLAAPLQRQWRVAGIALLAYALFCGWLWWRRRPAAPPPAAAGSRPWQVIWASQTGTAIELARNTMAQLEAAGLPARLTPIERVDAALLAGTDKALWIVSTTGEGDCPDHALRFAQSLMGQRLDLGHLQVAVLALGDRTYAHYCAFGHRLDHWLGDNGTSPLFPRIDVDNGNAQALSQWQSALAGIAGHSFMPLPTSSSTDAKHWQLQQRTHTNPGSQGGAVYHLLLTPADGILPAWQAGDIALITPQHSPQRIAQWLATFGQDGSTALPNGLTLAGHLATVELPQALPSGAPVQWALALPALKPREYSIASMPGEGHIGLLLRLFTGPDGHPGLGSGWLCDTLQPGQLTTVRLRSNPSFHPPAADVPLVLIGNGTGIAGLRAQLQARIDASATRNWLLFGERSRACDYHFGQDLERWQREGGLERLDLTFSRDGGTHRHVQHALAAQADELKRWLDAGAVVMVCGSLKGMAPDVDAVIVDILGQAGRDALLADGRYRRDVY